VPPSIMGYYALSLAGGHSTQRGQRGKIAPPKANQDRKGLSRICKRHCVIALFSLERTQADDEGQNETHGMVGPVRHSIGDVQ